MSTDRVQASLRGRAGLDAEGRKGGAAAGQQQRRRRANELRRRGQLNVDGKGRRLGKKHEHTASGYEREPQACMLVRARRGFE